MRALAVFICLLVIHQCRLNWLAALDLEARLRERSTLAKSKSTAESGAAVLPDAEDIRILADFIDMEADRLVRDVPSIGTPDTLRTFSVGDQPPRGLAEVGRVVDSLLALSERSSNEKGAGSSAEALPSGDTIACAS